MHLFPQLDVMTLSAAGLSRRSSDITLFRYQALGNSCLILDSRINFNAIGPIEHATWP